MKAGDVADQTDRFHVIIAKNRKTVINAKVCAGCALTY
jgi:hypothetical protein